MNLAFQIEMHRPDADIRYQSAASTNKDQVLLIMWQTVGLILVHVYEPGCLKDFLFWVILIVIYVSICYI